MKPTYERDIQLTEHAQLRASDDVPEILANGESHKITHTSHRRLLLRKEVELVLGLGEDQVRFLINTRQITAIRIAGEERYDSRDIERLIESYKATAQRRML
ncbi:MAG: hypothetical protein WA399_18345 [Acidobacteriaceae bacterium]